MPALPHRQLKYCKSNQSVHCVHNHVTKSLRYQKNVLHPKKKEKLSLSLICWGIFDTLKWKKSLYCHLFHKLTWDKLKPSVSNEDINWKKKNIFVFSLFYQINYDLQIGLLFVWSSTPWQLSTQRERLVIMTFSFIRSFGSFIFWTKQ